MIRVSASLLGSYLFMLEERISFDQFSRNIMSSDPPSLKMRAGTMFHHLIQNGQGMNIRDNAIDQIEKDKEIIVFDLEDIEQARQKVDKNSDIFEYKLRKLYSTSNGEVYVTGVADQIVGNVVHEFKTTYGAFSYDQYADSIQWKVYCSLFGVEEVKYQVWQLTEPTEDIEKIKPLKVKSYHEFSMFGNQCSEKMFLETLEGCVDLIYKSGLDKFLEMKE
jgi:hypothetical protein